MRRLFLWSLLPMKAIGLPALLIDIELVYVLAFGLLNIIGYVEGRSYKRS